jgi:hypothetical protein
MPTFARTQEIEHEIGPDGRFSLRLTSGNVELRAVDSDTARVRATYDVRADNDAEADEYFQSLQLLVQAHTRGIEIDEPRHGGSRGLAAIARLFGVPSYEFHVAAEIPRGAEVRFNGVSSDLTATGLRGRQQYRTVSGDMVLTELGGDLRLETVSGAVSLRGVAPIELAASSVSGDLAAMAPQIGLLRATTVSGDVEVEGELGRDREHRVETTSGDLTIGIVGGLAIEVRGLSSEAHISVDHRAEGSRDRRRYIIGGGGPSLSFRSMSGDVSVHAARRIVPSAAAPPPPPASPTPLSPAVDADEQLEILRAVERGEMDVDEAARRLAGGS